MVSMFLSPFAIEGAYNVGFFEFDWQRLSFRSALTDEVDGLLH